VHRVFVTKEEEMINCRSCKYHRVFNLLDTQNRRHGSQDAGRFCLGGHPWSECGILSNCSEYEKRESWWKRLLPKKRVYYSGTSQDNRKRDPNKPSDNIYGHHWGKRRHLGYAVCDWCNAVENTDESFTRCPMAELEKSNVEAIWVRVDKFGYHSIGYGKFGSGSVYFEYPEPSYAPFPKEQE
jgi:hypothetical protein